MYYNLGYGVLYMNELLEKNAMKCITLEKI
jgi:hypothetical protein